MPSRAGSPNRNKAFLLNRLQEMYGDDFHPIIQIAKNCVELQEKVDGLVKPEPDDNGVCDQGELDTYAANKVAAIKVANNEWSRIAEYTEPKLKAIELTGPGGGPIQTDSIFEFVPVDSKS